MPLLTGTSSRVISRNIHELTVNGSKKRSHDQIVAIALSQADRSKKKKGYTKTRVRGKKTVRP